MLWVALWERGTQNILMMVCTVRMGKSVYEVYVCVSERKKETVGLEHDYHEFRGKEFEGKRE